jgi:hypothetical protein
VEQYACSTDRQRIATQAGSQVDRVSGGKRVAGGSKQWLGRQQNGDRRMLSAETAE